MNVEYSKPYFVSAADASPNGRLSITSLTQRIIEIATEHANSLGIGNPDMADSRGGWVLVRLAIEMAKFPDVNTSYRLVTWIESWNRMFSSRCFAIETNDGILGYARTTWMVINLDTHENLGLTHLVLPDGAVSMRECPIAGQSRHLPSPDTPEAKYIIKYSDLDFYRHVNTLKWIEIILDRYSLVQFDTHRIGRFEIGFASEGHYNDIIEIYRTPIDNSELSNQWKLVHNGNTLVTAVVRLIDM